ncbi:MAG TPA: NAD(P)/FAD-dependent oxidoreductase [Terriglobales bacterium]|nr:NAD(P)/FAD-dependent oxidoreductase [Terriglobales bacterium]
MAPLVARAKETRPSAAGNREPVAIIGAGLAGLTAAYRLHQAGIACEIFEGSERTGGRVLTKYDFNKDAMFCELGGELVDSNHQDLITLARDLGVDIQELKGIDRGADLYFFGGKHYADEQLIPLFQPFARKLAADLEGIYDKGQNLTAKAQRFDKISLGQYLAESSKGVENWVIDLLRVAYTIEYGRDVDEQSALNLIVYLKPETSNGFKIFGDSDESKRIKGGSSSLPNALAKAIAGKVKIQQGHNLLKIAETNSNLILTFGTDGGSKEVKFTRVICTLPFTMLRLVDGVKALALSEPKQNTIAQLGYGNNSKVMYGFTERWWRNPALKLPAASNGSVFTDLTLQCTWESSRGQTGESGILTNFLGGAAAVKRLTDASFEKFREELLLVFPGIGDKFDGKRALMSWPDYKFTRGSYSCPLVGQYTTLLQAAPTPELGGRLLFAGEHTSGDFAGFMNGAVQSGNRAAKEILEAGNVKLRKAA